MMDATTIEWSDEGRTALFAAYAKAQGEMGEVRKNATNPAFKNKYADLSAVLDAVLPPMNKYALAIIQAPTFDGEWVAVETFVTHADGGWFRSSLKLRPSKVDPQGVGSAITYGRRYAVLALAGVAPEDDDGHAASGPQERFHPRDDYRSPPAAVVAARAAIASLNTVAECEDWWRKNKAGFDGMPKADVDMIIGELSARKKAVMPPPKAAPQTGPLQSANNQSREDEARFRGGGSGGVAGRNGSAVDHGRAGSNLANMDDEIPFASCNFFAEPIGAVIKG